MGALRHGGRALNRFVPSKNNTMNKTFVGTLEQLIDQLPTAAITPVYRICEKNNYPEDRVVTVQIINDKLLVF